MAVRKIRRARKSMKSRKAAVGGTRAIPKFAKSAGITGGGVRKLRPKRRKRRSTVG